MQLFEDLYELIATFDKNEKRQFKLRIAAQSKTADEYSQLFDYFGGLKAWEGEKNEIALRRKWGHNLMARCKSLYQWLLRIIEDMHQDAPYQQIWHICLQIDALFKRRLYEQAWRRMDELEQKADSLDLPMMKLLAFNWRLSLMWHIAFNFRGLNNLQEFEQFLGRGAAAIAEVDREFVFDVSTLQLSYYYHKLKRGEEQTRLMKELMSKPLLTSYSDISAVSSKVKYFNLHIFYALTQNKYDKIVDLGLEYWAFLITVPDGYRVEGSSFFGLWHNLILASAYSERWAVLEEYHQKLLTELPKLPQTMPFADLLVEPAEFAFLLMYYRRGQKEVLKAKFGHYLELIQASPSKLSPARISQMTYFLALISYQNGDFRQAQELLLPQIKRKPSPAAFVLQSVMRFLYLCLLYEQSDNPKLLRYVRRLLRWYRKTNELGLIEKRWLIFFKYAAQNAPKAKLRRKLTKLQNAALAPKSQLSAHDTELLFYFPLAEWVARILVVSNK
jgi:hypothetical protein